MRLTSSVSLSVAQTIIALSSVELTSILVPSHRLRIMALLSSGCRATVDCLTNVQSSSTTQQWQATSLDDNNLHVPCRLSSKHFISGQLKFIPLVRYSVIPYSAFYSVPWTAVILNSSEISGGFRGGRGVRGGKGVQMYSPLAASIMYFCLRNCTSPSNDYAAVACSNNNQAQLHTHVSVPY